jgi:hypothetical protein
MAVLLVPRYKSCVDEIASMSVRENGESQPAAALCTRARGPDEARGEIRPGEQLGGGGELPRGGCGDGGGGGGNVAAGGRRCVKTDPRLTRQRVGGYVHRVNTTSAPISTCTRRSF